MKKAKFVLYRDTAREWRWRFVASNGRILADSAEAYKRKADMLTAIHVLMDAIFTGGIGKIR